MNFRAAHVMRGISVDDYESLYFDEEFNKALCAHVHLGRKLQRYEVIQGVLYRDVEVSPQRALPAPLQAFLKEDTMSYVEHIEYVLGSHRVKWRTTTAVVKDKIKSA